VSPAARRSILVVQKKSAAAASRPWWPKMLFLRFQQNFVLSSQFSRDLFFLLVIHRKLATEKVNSKNAIGGAPKLEIGGGSAARPAQVSSAHASG